MSDKGLQRLVSMVVDDRTRQFGIHNRLDMGTLGSWIVRRDFHLTISFNSHWVYYYSEFDREEIKVNVEEAKERLRKIEEDLKDIGEDDDCMDLKKQKKMVLERFIKEHSDN